MISIERGRKGREKMGGRGRGKRWGEVAVMQGRGLLLEGNRLFFVGATPEEGGDVSERCFDAATPTKAR